jgi:hypothetical protein
MCRKNAKSGRSRTCILHCAAASVTVLACPVLRVLFSFLGDARVALQSLNNGPNLSGCLQTDVEEACELRARHPAEITQALIPCTEKGFQNDGPEPEAMLRQGRHVIEPDVHPARPIRTSRSGAFA